MKFTKLNGDKLYSVNIIKYKVDWERKVSAPQFKIKSLVKKFWEHNVVLEEFVIPGSRLRLDLFNTNKKIVLEVSPDCYHSDYNSFLHGNRHKFLDKIKKDFAKRNWCERNNLSIIELTDKDIEAFSAPYILEEYGIEL